jgi:thymidylate synthase (FAD)
MTASLVSVTPDAEHVIAYCARVSNPTNQENKATEERLLRYCAKHHHWSIFEQADMTVEVTTTLAIATQLLRHRSFVFQQFSQRYAVPATVEAFSLREQDLANRQNSTHTLPEDVTGPLLERWERLRDQSLMLYQDMLNSGVAKECARFVLPQCTTTRLYMKGSLRSWITYLQTRSGTDTQEEHREIANQIQEIFAQQFPMIARAFEFKGPLETP